MALPISPEDMETYRAAARRRHEERAERLAQRRARAWELAGQAARVLKEEFAAARVVAFGSVLAPEHFDEHSDLDLAVWGLAEQEYFQALGRLLSLDAGIAVDLVEAERAPDRLRTVVESQGVAL